MSSSMARLNEPTAPEESVEALKRKFFRQNRDIARANSSQSLRIRNLENEVSRLLTENLTLRSQIFRLQNELESRQSQQIVDNVSHIKAQLESKLLEIGALVTGLDTLPPPVKQESPRRDKTTRASHRRSIDPSRPKVLYSMGDMEALDEAKLPTIMENKQYPRRTLEREELMRILSDSANSDSPDLGSPPVSQFVNPDPVKIELPQKEPAVLSLENNEPVMSVNFEQRRKRRDSTAVGASASRFASSSTLNEAAPSLKVGAKRKLSARDELNDTETTSQSPADDFKYSRQPEPKAMTTGELKVASKSCTDAPVSNARDLKRDQTITIPPPQSPRKALGPKNGNVDLASSPKKKASIDFKDGKPSTKSDLSIKEGKVAVRSRDRKRDTISMEILQPKEMKVVEVRPEPETPASHDLYNIPNTQPSTVRASVRDTPPPGELIDGHRPSRRARAAVSYAEPNLRDKMRRPTKELVDAVTGEPKSRKSSSLGSMQVDQVMLETSGGADGILTTIPAADLQAAGENSPLRSKITVQPQQLDTAAIESQPVVAEDKSKELARRLERVPAKSTSSLAPARQPAPASARSNSSIEQAMAKLDIYDFDDSSPKRSASQASVRAEKYLSRNTKRHSIATQSTVRSGEAASTDLARKLSTHKRRQSTIGSSAGESSIRDDVTKAEERLLKRSNSNAALTESAAAAGRAERIAARRKSMML